MAPKSRDYRDGGIIPRAGVTRASCVFMRSSGAGKGEPGGEIAPTCGSVICLTPLASHRRVRVLTSPLPLCQRE
jgi:hypothetical protein